MAKFLGAICTLLAGLCLVGAVDVTATRNLTSTEFVEEVAAASLENPAARDEIVDELVVWLDDQPARRAALQAQFGEEWQGPVRDAAQQAIETPEFETAYLDAFEKYQDAEPGQSASVSLDLRPTFAAVSPQLDPDVAESLDQLPPDFFVASETIETEQLDDLNNFRQLSRQALFWFVIIGLAATVLSIAAFRSVLPVAWIGAIAVGMSLLQLALLRAIRNDVVADQEDAIQQVGADAVFDSLEQSAVLRLLIIGLILIVAAIAGDRALGRLRGDSSSDDMPTGSDTDWAEPGESHGIPQLIS